MSCLFSSSGNFSFEPDPAPVPPTHPLTRLQTTFLPMDTLFVCADDSLQYALLALHKEGLPPGTPPPGLLLNAKGVVHAIALLQNILHLLEQHPQPVQRTPDGFTDPGD